MAHPLAAAVTALTGVAAPILAQAAGSDIPGYVGLGAQGIAVAGLVYVVRALLSGDLVARRSADVQQTLSQLVEAGLARERVLEGLLRQRDRDKT